MRRMRPLHAYMIGTGTWFLSVGIQGVMFAWLVTMVLRESPEMVGVAQMTLLLPGTLLILVGGSYADRYGGRRVAVVAQSVAVTAPVILLCLVYFGQLSLTAMLVYAFVMGCAQAFVTPARDGLLNQVASGRVQRTVMLASVTQFGLQILGFLVAALADRTGPVPVLSVQALVLAVGVWALHRIHVEPEPAMRRETERTPASEAAPHSSLVQSVLEGSRTVLGHIDMRAVALMNVFMAIFFMGSYIVTLPLLVREVFDGGADDLGMMNACNGLGLVSALLFLLRFGDIKRQGRALLLSQGFGAVALASAGAVPSFALLLLVLFFWGGCGGIAMGMARTIMQERAPEGQRGRVMAFSGFSFMGAGPIGALGCGFLVDEFGPRLALGIAAAGMACILLVLAFRSSLWRMTTNWAK